MDLERWKQVDSLLQSVLERRPEDREAFLRQACGDDHRLESEVRSLLALERKAGSFLQTPVMEADLPKTTSSLAGKTISHYRVIEKLAEGGMGTVWKARDTRLSRYVALKLLHAAALNDPERKRRFVQEARAASALNHPNIITIHDIDQADGTDFIAMEFVAGKTLDQLIARKGLRLKQAVDYAIQVADALAAAHAAGIVHRDMKPANIMVSESGCVKVLDFGLAKLTEKVVSENAAGVTSESFGTDEGMILGTVSYMSPEQAEGKKVDARSDIFSFGALFYEMITGRRAFPGDSMVSILSAVLRDEPKRAGEILKDLPRDLDKIVMRCLCKDPNQRYQHAGDLKIDLQQVDPQRDKEESASGGPAARPNRRGLLWLMTAGACVVASFTIGRWFRTPEVPPVASSLTQLTRDAGLSNRPALSRDGKLMAYSSDAGRDGGMDLYVRQVAGGQPIRLTTDGAGNTWPDFSPDGSKIVFSSNRGGGGIYEIPAFGGQIRLLARNGLRPRFSPDGSKVAYWIGPEGVVDTVPGAASVWVIPAAGGQPQRVGSGLTAARAPIWSPDGKRLLFIGYTSDKLYDTSSVDWWLAAVDESEKGKTGLHDALIRAGLPAGGFHPLPSCWLADANTVIFSSQSGDARNLWEIGLSPQTGKVIGLPRRLTEGAGIEEDVSCASAGALAFTSRESTSHVWTLPFDLNRGSPAGPSERITQGPGERGFPSLSKNGRVVAFFSNESGQTNIWKRDLGARGESIVSRSSLMQRFPVVSPSGARIAFAVNGRDDSPAVYVASPDGEPEKVCEPCTRPTDWSSDEKSLLIYGGTPYQVNLLDVATHRQMPLLKHPTYHLLYGHFSPDNRWVSFTIRTSSTRARVAIAPYAGPQPIPESAWINIADVWIEDWAHWSPDGRTLFFPSERDGHKCLWGQRIDTASHRPTGEPFAAWHFHGRASYAYCCKNGWSAAAERIAIALTEDTGNIWLMSRPGAR